MAWLSWHLVPDLEKVKYDAEYDEIVFETRLSGPSMTVPRIKVKALHGTNPFIILAQLRQAVDEAFIDQLNKMED